MRRAIAALAFTTILTGCGEKELFPPSSVKGASSSVVPWVNPNAHLQMEFQYCREAPIVPYDEHTRKRQRSWVDATISQSRSRRIPAIIVDKKKHVLYLYESGKRVKTYPIELSEEHVHDKVMAGDCRTPELQDAGRPLSHQ
jgi:murein L,D-transpeptidase YafK